MLNLLCHLLPKGVSFRHVPIQFPRKRNDRRGFSSPSSAKKSIVAVRKKITLDPKLLETKDFVDFSNATWPCISWKLGSGPTINVRFTYAVVDHDRRPFPDKTSGFLYWHRDPRLPITTSEIRLRLMQKDSVENFSDGTDLIGISGLPWSIKLLRIARDTKRWGLQRLIIQSKLIESGVFERMSKAFEDKNISSIQRREELYYLEQPFVLDMEQDMCSLRIVTPNFIRDFDFRSPFSDTQLSESPYTGQIIVNFERMMLPGHRDRSIVLRVSKILQPPQSKSPDKTRYPLPQAGCLLEHSVKGRMYPRTFELPYHGTLPSIFMAVPAK